MIHVEGTSWGIRVASVGSSGRQEMSKMLDDLRKALPSARPLFGTVVDASAAETMNPDVRDLIIHALSFMASRGMVRMAVAAPSSLMASQFKRLSAEADLLGGLRCLDSRREGWKDLAESWAISGREPTPEFLFG
jgi:hypothetical protein